MSDEQPPAPRRPWLAYLGVAGLSVAGTLAVVAAIGIGYVAWNGDDWLAEALVDAAAEHLGADLEVGELDFTTKGAHITDVRFSIEGDTSSLTVVAPDAELDIDKATLVSQVPRITAVRADDVEVQLKLPAYGVPSIYEIAGVAVGRVNRNWQKSYLPAAVRTDASIDEVVLDGAGTIALGDLVLPVTDLHYEARGISPSSVPSIFWDSRLEGRIWDAPFLLDTRDDMKLEVSDVDLPRWDALRADRWLQVDTGTFDTVATATSVTVTVDDLGLSMARHAPLIAQTLATPLMNFVEDNDGDFELTVALDEGWTDPFAVLIEVWWALWSHIATQAKDWMVGQAAAALRNLLPW